MPDLSALLSPRSVALIGASPDTGTLRGRIMHILARHEFAGQLYPVSRSHDTIMGRAAFATIADVPGPVDLAVIVIPAAHVPGVLRDCAAAGVRAALVLASGFAEEPSEGGRDLQGEIREISERTGLIVAGPNSEGLAVFELGLAATFSPVLDGDGLVLVPDAGPPGRIAAVAQSGGMGFAYFDRGRRKGLRFSHVVTTGNEACLESLDVVEYLVDTDGADIFLLFMEDVKTPSRLASVAARALRAGKPLIVAKIGRSEAAARAAASHTASLAGSHEVYQALFRRHGVIEGRDLDQMLDIAAGFAAFGNRLPAGRNVAIFTGSGGAGGWLADACVDAGLEVPVLDDETRARIDVHLPPYGTSQNPVDGTAGVIRQLGYARIARMIAASPRVDAILLITSARNPHSLVSEADALAGFAAETTKPVIAWSYTLPHPDAARTLARAGVPLVTEMRNAPAAIAALEIHARARQRALAAAAGSCRPVTPAVVSALAGAPRVVPEVEAMSILSKAGFSLEPGRLAADADEAARAAGLIGGPVALKVQSPDIPHKSAAGGVVLGCRTPEDVRAGFRTILDQVSQRHPDARIQGILVQPMARPGLEMILGIENSSGFGPMVLVGFGGTAVETGRDVALVAAPLDPSDAAASLDRLRGAAMLDPSRHDLDALCALMCELGRFAVTVGDYLAEVDLNPVLVHPPGSGVSIVDALMVTR